SWGHSGAAGARDQSAWSIHVMHVALDSADMATWIALIRGINVGGRHKLPMAELRAELERAGFSAVRTYIQSGNVVFECARGTADSIARRMGELVGIRFGFEPKILVLAARDLEKAASANPFPAAHAAPKSLQLFFLAAAPRPAAAESLP